MRGDMYLSIKSDELQKIIQSSDQPLLVYFYASWCGPCRKMSPEFDSLASELEGLYKFIKISIDDVEEAAIHCKVNAVPTVLFIKDGKEITRLAGFRSKEAMRDVMALAFN